MLKSAPKGYDEAVAANGEIKKFVDALRMTMNEAEIILTERSLRTLVKPGIYEHFKSDEDDQKLYAVYGVVPDVNSVLLPMVNYAALYLPHAGEMVGRVLYDSEDGFWGPIDRPEYKGPRFKLIYPMKREQLDLILGKAELGRFPKNRTTCVQIIETAFPHLK